MTLSEAERKLKAARQKAKTIQQEINQLKELILDLGGDLYPKQTFILQRNKVIYKRWADGATARELATEYKLSTTRITGICNRIQAILVKGDLERFPEYKDLLPYKK